METSLAQDLIAANLRRLRRARDLSQERLAQEAGLSRVAYRNIEGRKSSPRTSTLLALASALEVSLEALIRPVPRIRHARFRSLKRLNSREQVLADVSDWLKNYQDLETLLNERRKYRLETLVPVGPSSARSVKLAADVRQQLKIGPREAIRDICGLLESCGIKVFPIRIASDAFFGLSVAADGGGPAVIVNTWDRISVERWIFTAAHELGHLLLHRDAYDLTRTEEEDREEKEANTFAAHFLMPDEAFCNEWGEAYGLGFVDRVLKVKRMFRVSYKTVLYRLSETPQRGSEVWVRFQLEYKRRFGASLLKTEEPQALGMDSFRGMSEPFRAGEPDHLSPSDFEEDRLRGLVRRAIEQEKISLSRGAEILGLSLKEMRALAASWVA